MGGPLHRGHILALPAILMMPLAILAPKGLAVLFIVSALAALAWGRVYKERLRWPPISFLLPFAVFITYAVISSSWSPTPLVSLKSSISLGLTTFGGLALVSFARRLSLSENTVLTYALIIGAFLALALFAIEIATDAGIWNRVWAFKNGQPVLPGTHQSMVVYNSAMSVGTLFIWPLLLLWMGQRRAFAIIGVLLLAVIIKWSEADTPALAILLGILTVLVLWRARTLVLFACGGVVVVLMFAAPLIPPLLPGSDTVRAEMPYLSPSAVHRTTIWKVAAKHIAENPVTGLGMDTSRSLYSRETKVGTDYPSPEPGEATWHNFFEPIPLHPHNSILQIWLELGGIGIAVLAWIVFVLVRIARDHQVPPPVFGFYVSSLVIASLSFGAWQSWWVCALWLSASLLVSQLPSAKLSPTAGP